MQKEEDIKPSDGQCAFFLSKKKRFCRFRPNKDHKYCAEHAAALGVEMNRKRIQCPLNPKHSCYEDALKKHLKKCNSRKRKTEEYYEEGINAGSDEGDTTYDINAKAVRETETQRLQELIERVNTTYKVSTPVEAKLATLDEHENIKERRKACSSFVKGLDCTQLKNYDFFVCLESSLFMHGISVRKHGNTYTLEHIGTVESDVKSHDCLRDELENPNYGLPALRHRRQQASLIGQLDSLGLLAPGYCYVEMGAGKGRLSHWVREAVSNHNDASFLLVDRNSVRYKVDGYHKEETVPFERIRIDIEHLNLGKVPMIKHSDKRVVAIGKHLCGAATDLTLRCLVETLDNVDSLSSEPPSKRQCRELGLALCSEHSESRETSSRDKDNLKKNLNRKLAGMVIALCCHHQCRWSAYVGKKFMSQCNISAADFDLLTRLSSWAVCGWRGLDSSSDPKAEPEGSHNGSEEAEHIPIKANGVKCRETSGIRKNYEQQYQVILNATDDKVPDLEGIEEAKRVTVNSTGDSLQETLDAEHKTDDLLKDTCKGSLNLSELEKEAIGWRCKRLIDFGRVRYLEEHGMKTVIKEYIEKLQTPENVALVALCQACKHDQ